MMNASEWNSKYPVGISVKYYPAKKGNGEIFVFGETIEPAWDDPKLGSLIRIDTFIGNLPLSKIEAVKCQFVTRERCITDTEKLSGALLLIEQLREENRTLRERLNHVLGFVQNLEGMIPEAFFEAIEDDVKKVINDNV